VINTIKIKAPIALFIFIAGLWIGLSGCQSDPVLDVDLCQPYDGLTPLCGYQSPEDLALLPDSSGLLVSEFGHMGETQGQLSILSIADHSRKVIYTANMHRQARSAVAIWGDPNCSEPQSFSPHGFDLAQRPSGRWQLLVVNHAEHERIEFFELSSNEGSEWSVIWRGCVQSIDDSIYNDVAAVNDGFVVSRMMSSQNTGLAMLNYFLGRDTGYIWRWSLANGFQSVAHSEGVMPNGVVASKNGGQVFINLYGEDKVRVVDTNSQKVLTELDIQSADNSNWDVTQADKLLVASHDFNFLSMSECMSGGDNNCVSPFEIIELDSVDYSQQSLVVSDGRFFGAATAAVRLEDQIYIGSFSGNRILIAPVGYGVVQ
jgi:hypothetical protein